MSEDAPALSVDFDGYRFDFDTRSGRFSLSSWEGPLLEKALGRISWHSEGGYEIVSTAGEWQALGKDDSGFSAARREAWGELLFKARRRGGGIQIEIGLRWNDDAGTPGIYVMEPLAVPPGGIWPGIKSTKHWRFYFHGWQCWSPTGVLKCSRPGDYLYPLFFPSRLKPMVANPGTEISSERGSFRSEWFGALGDLDRGDSLVVGFTGVDRALSQVSAKIGRKPEQAFLEAASQFEGIRPERGEEFWGEPLALIPGDLSGGNLEEYASMVALEQGVDEVRRAPAGWCSWYQYFTDVTGEDVRDNLELLSGEYSDLAVEVVQVDDGYQNRVGDWLEADQGFSCGMDRLADEIISRGKVPGIWVAPFAVARRSRIFREKKEWVLKNKRGRPVLAGVNPAWKGRFHGLDLTNEEVLDWIREVFSTFRRYGYRFFKLDFMAAGLLDGDRSNRNVTKAQAARRALRVIRDAVGDESYLLAAGGPILLGTGILDAQRIGPDVAPRWSYFWQGLLRDRTTPAARNCLIGAMTRAFMNGRLFEADPDCLLVRARGTSLNRTERRTLASGVSLVGGTFMLSDDMALWGVEERKMACALLPHSAGTARCPDLWSREVPRYLIRDLEDPSGGYHLLWVVNWRGGSREFEVRLSELGLEPGRYHACEFWTGEYLGEVSDSLKLGSVPGHGSAVVRLTPCGELPRLVGSAVHITQGSVELELLERERDSVSLSMRSGAVGATSVTLSVPGVDAVTCDDPKVTVSRVGKSAYRLEFYLDQKKEIKVRYGDG